MVILTTPKEKARINIKRYRQAFGLTDSSLATAHRLTTILAYHPQSQLPVRHRSAGKKEQKRPTARLPQCLTSRRAEQGVAQFPPPLPPPKPTTLGIPPFLNVRYIGRRNALGGIFAKKGSRDYYCPFFPPLTANLFHAIPRRLWKEVCHLLPRLRLPCDPFLLLAVSPISARLAGVAKKPSVAVLFCTAPPSGASPLALLSTGSLLAHCGSRRSSALSANTALRRCGFPHLKPGFAGRFGKPRWVCGASVAPPAGGLRGGSALLACPLSACCRLPCSGVGLAPCPALANQFWGDNPASSGSPLFRFFSSSFLLLRLACLSWARHGLRAKQCVARPPWLVHSYPQLCPQPWLGLAWLIHSFIHSLA